MFVECLNEWVSWILKAEQWVSQLKSKKEKRGGNGYEKPQDHRSTLWAVGTQSNPVWLQWSVEPARVKGLGPKPHILKSRVARSHCVAQTSSQSVDTGRITGWQPFLRSMIIIVWNYLSLFCVHTWPDVFSWPYLTSREVREKGKVWIWGMSGGDSLVFVVSHLCCFSFFDMGFDFYSPDVDECANPRSCPGLLQCQS